jgi:glycosyltransferase involved in cell wall biosynthesis
MARPHICVVAPCYNEGDVAVRFVQELCGVLAGLEATCEVLMVDDASIDDTAVRLRALGGSAAGIPVRVLELPYNVGHQEAIHRGLEEASRGGAERFVVMDSDGEDDPAALPQAIARNASIVLIARGRRHENWRFRLGYAIYRRLFRLITRRSISFGNYSVIDRRVLRAVLEKGFTHYAAFLSKQKASTELIVSDRRARIDGRSKMGFKSLSIHAFRSLIEYSDEVLALFLRAFFGLALLLVATIVAIVCVKLFTDKAIPGWASILGVSLLNSTLLCLGFFAIGLQLSQSMARKDRVRR